jgi:hypothetical protein
MACCRAANMAKAEVRATAADALRLRKRRKRCDEPRADPTV